MKTEYDIIIIGAGCAGLQLMRAILQHPQYSDQTILLIDDGKSAAQDKSWCFWHSSSHHVYESLIEKSWSSLSVGLTEKTLTQSIHPYRYSYINSKSFFDHHYQLIHNSPTVHHKIETVLTVQQEQLYFSVCTDQGKYTGAQVYTSDWSSGAALKETDMRLRQYFYGWFIETIDPVFDTSAATLMDLDTLQKPGVNFMYVLPFTAHTALVEWTSFSAEPFEKEFNEAQIHDYVRRKWKTNYTIKKTETGCLPMTSHPFKRFTKAGAVAIGTAAGRVKPTTGYAFTRILRDSEQLASALLTNKPAAAFTNSRFRFYDRLLLDILESNPLQGHHILQELFRQVSFPQVLQFLDEDSSLWGEMKLFNMLPKTPFLKSLIPVWNQR